MAKIRDLQWGEEGSGWTSLTMPCYAGHSETGTSSLTFSEQGCGGWWKKLALAAVRTGVREPTRDPVEKTTSAVCVCVCVCVGGAEA
jgi:hypothetical protein